jgi:glucan endo-1,3-alpha-glucosidase
MFTLAGSECWCANSITSGATSSTGCTMTCSGNSAQTCGGSWAINIYQVVSGSTTPTTTITTTTTTTTSSSSSTPTWSSLGCYQDSSSRVLSSYSTTSSSNTPTYCQSLCSSKGYSFAGTEYSQECYCGSALNGATSIASSNCNDPCAGNSALTCGGSWAINIYQLTSGGTATTTTTSTTTSTSSTTSTTTSSATPATSKVVVAHHMVGNTYSYTQATWSTNIQAAIAGGIDGFALNVGIDSWQPQRVAWAYAAALGTSFKLFVSLDMTYVPVPPISAESHISFLPIGLYRAPLLATPFW